MITVKEAVLSSLYSDYIALKSMSRGLINMSKYAREILPEVNRLAKKTVTVQSIVVALSRLEKELMESTNEDVCIEQLSIQSPVTQLVYVRNEVNTGSLLRVAGKIAAEKHSFFSFSTSTKDIALLSSDTAVSSIICEFEEKPTIQKTGLSAISIRFSESGVAEANVGLTILSKMASRDIPLDAALTTYNEFTLILSSTYLQSAVDALTPKK